MPQTAAKKKVSMIPAKPQYDRSIKLSEKKLRVAAYCRVSTELEEQESATRHRWNIIPEKYRKQTTGRWSGFMPMTEKVQPTLKNVTISMP